MRALVFLLLHYWFMIRPQSDDFRTFSSISSCVNTTQVTVNRPFKGNTQRSLWRTLRLRKITWWLAAVQLILPPCCLMGHGSRLKTQSSLKINVSKMFLSLWSCDVQFIVTLASVSYWWKGKGGGASGLRAVLNSLLVYEQEICKNYCWLQIVSPEQDDSMRLRDSLASFLYRGTK